MPRFHSKMSAGCPQSRAIQSPQLLPHSASTLWADDKLLRTDYALIRYAAKTTLTEFGPQKTAQACHLSLCQLQSEVAINLEGISREGVSKEIYPPNHRPKGSKAEILFQTVITLEGINTVDPI